ncbi:MAG: 16S rRNA (guanine(527)-N(7))-methyltransferase RsmG [Bacillota bacterium]|nr:16S rRNA (guanine(527)-N(7))-methyltransferase RsmG [Bacillota bacterium]
MDELCEIIERGLTAAGVAYDATLPQACAAHWRLLTAANARFNLTAITSAAEAARKHYLDVLLTAPLFARLADAYGGAAADIGSGGGFPALPLAIACPRLEWTLLEAAQKKTAFLNEAAAALGLSNVRAVALRAEDAGRGELRGGFDIVTARAVAPLSVLSEYALPLLRAGGVFAAFKGANAAAELAAAQRALAVLGGTYAGQEDYTLPDGEQRAVLLIVKTAATPDKYPRRAGMPAKKPL